MILAVGLVPFIGMIEDGYSALDEQNQIVYLGVPGGIIGLFGLFSLGAEVLRPGLSSNLRRNIIFGMVGIGFVTAAYVAYLAPEGAILLLVAGGLPAFTAIQLLVLLRRKMRDASNN